MLSSKERLLKARNTIHSFTLVLVLAVVLLAAGGASAQDSSGTTHQGLTASQRTVLLSKTETKIKRYTQSLRHWEIVLGRSHRHLGYQPGSSTSLAYVKWVLSQRMAASRKLHNAAKHVMVKRTKLFLADISRFQDELGLRHSTRQLADADGVEDRFNQTRSLRSQLANKWQSSSLYADLMCIHNGWKGKIRVGSGEGGFTSVSPGNPHYDGGWQMDLTFQLKYGLKFYKRWGTADKWPSWAQLYTAAKAYQSGRGYYPWPNTAHDCGLI